MNEIIDSKNNTFEDKAHRGSRSTPKKNNV